MILYPKKYYHRVTDIKLEELQKSQIKGIILDVDNTLIDLNKNLLEGATKWCKNLQENGIKFCIVSNSNSKERVENVAKALNVPFIFWGMKPLKYGIKKAKEKMDLSFPEMAIVGDQIFTDILGGNRCKMYTILVDPISKNEFWITSIKRGIEAKIIKKYKESNKK